MNDVTQRPHTDAASLLPADIMIEPEDWGGGVADRQIKQMRKSLWSNSDSNQRKNRKV